MVGGFGQLPGAGVATDFSTQVSLALLLTGTTNVRRFASVFTFGKELICRRLFSETRPESHFWKSVAALEAGTVRTQ